MITESYKNVIKANLAGANVTSGNYVALAQITTPAGDIRYAASGIVEGALQFSTSSTGVGIKVGSGTTAATPNDYNLQSLITNGLSGTVTNVDKSVSDGSVLITYNLTLTNTSGSSITVAEIGAFRKVGQAGSSSGTTSTSQTDQNTVFMVDRSLLSAPLAIPAGAAATITYTLKTVDAEGGTVTDEDNGKVVVNGELVSQTQRSITANGTYDTTTNNSVLVDVPSSGGASTLVSKTITENGTYDPSDDSADGYSEVNVNLPLLRRKSYIPYTDQTRILQELTWADYDTENHTFGDFILFGSSYPTVDANGLLLGENTYLAYDLVNVKRDITAYVVCKRHSSLSGDRYIFGCPSTGTFGEVEEEAVPAFTVDGADVNCVTTLINHVYNYRSDYPIYSGDDYIVLSMQIVRGESRSVAYFSRGRRSWQGDFRHDAHLRYFYLGGDGKKKSDGTTTNSDYYFLYVAIVDGIDDIVGQSSFGAGTLNEDFLYNSINELKTAPHMSLTTKTITANGTFDALNDNADGYSQVTVNVPTSGGGTVATYEIPDFIENSTKRNILFDLYADDYNEADNSWGNLQFVTDTDTFLTDSAGVMALTSQGLEIGGKYSYRYNVSNVSAATIYLIARRRQYLSPSDEALLALEHWVGEVGENGINPLRIGTRHTSGDSDEYVYFPRTNGTYVDQPIQKFNVYTLAFNGDAHRANLYVNGAFVSYMQINSDYVFTHVDIGVDCDVQVLYAGMVAGVEPSTTIIRNQQIATSFFANAQVALWDEDTLVPSFLTYSNQGDILINSSYLEYDKTNNVFGDFTTLCGTLSSDCEGVRVDDDTMLTYGLPAGTTSVTVYAIIKGVIAPNDTSTAALVQLGNSSGSGNGVILGYSNQLKAGTYPASSGSWYQPVTALTVYAISVNCSTNKASFYADGVLVATVDISDSPYDTLSIGGAYLSGVANSATDVQFLYVGLVDGAESQSVIVQNCAQMISFLEDARIAVALGTRTLIQKTITANGTYNPANDNAYAYSQVTVNVSSQQPNLQSKKVNSNGAVTADAGYDGLSRVDVQLFPFELDRRLADTGLNALWTDYNQSNATWVPVIEKWDGSEDENDYSIIVHGAPTVISSGGIYLGETSWLEIPINYSSFTIYVIARQASPENVDGILVSIPDGDGSSANSYPCVMYAPDNASSSGFYLLNNAPTGTYLQADEIVCDPDISSGFLTKAIAVSVDGTSVKATGASMHGDSDVMSKSASHGNRVYIGAGYNGDYSGEFAVFYIGIVVGAAQSFTRATWYSTSGMGHRNLAELEILANSIRYGYI